MIRVLVLPVLLAALVAQQPQVGGQLAAATLPTDWAERDLEGKWVAYREAVAAANDGKTQQSWAMALGQQKELELLEWIAVYESWQFAGPELVRHEAPQMVRCAVWNLGALDTHAKDAAKKVLLARADRALGWFEAYPTAAVGAAAELRNEMLNRGIAAKRNPADLPPFDAMQMIVPWLDAPRELVAFGDRKTAERRVRYEHQVVRALGAVLVHGDRDARIVTKVTKLAGHANGVVRQAAFDTLAKLPAGMVPYAAMAAIVADGEAAVARRNAAVVVLSFSAHPAAMDLLVRLALDPAHPCHGVACSRLSERGDPVAAEPLRQAHVATAEHERVIDQIVMAVEQRHRQGLLMTHAELRRMMLRVAWLRVKRSDNAAAVAAATSKLLRAGSSNDLTPVIEGFLGLPAPPSPFPAGIADLVEQELRSFAREVLRK